MFLFLFQNEQSADPRRQISFNQQGQILSDVQLNHQRFGLQSSASNDFIRQPFTQNNFPLQQSSININQPIPFAQSPQQFNVQQPLQFRPIPQQATQSIVAQSQIQFEQPLIDNNQEFLQQPIIHQQPNIQYQQIPQIKENNFFNQPTNGHQQRNPIEVQSVRSSHQLQPQVPTLQSFLPTIPTQDTQQSNKYNFERFQQTSQLISANNVPETLHIVNPPNQNNAHIAFQNNVGATPLFSSNQGTQLQTLLEEERKQDLERLRDLQERQKIIQKHKQFIERQQQKSQQKVAKLHEDFTIKQKKKQEEIIATARPIYDYTQKSKPREILNHEIDLFQKAIKQHEQLNPTTARPTTTTTTPKPPPKRPSNKSRTRQRMKSRSESDTEELYIQANRQKIYKQLKSVLNENGEPNNGNVDSGDVAPNKLQFIQKQDILKQLKLAIAENSDEFNGKNFTSREISLPNGEKFEIIKTTDPNLIAGATPLSADSSTLSQRISSSLNQIRTPETTKQTKLSFEELNKDLLPPGANYEIIKQGGNGKLEEVGALPDEKKVTFVFIEEQNDGTYKVKGVKGNENSKDAVPDVDSILTKIKEGEIQLPPITKKPNSSWSTKPTHSTSEASSSHSQRKTSAYSPRPTTTYVKPTTPKRQESTFDHFEATKLHSQPSTTPRYYNSQSPSSLSINHNGSPSSISEDYDSTTYPTTLNSYKSSRAEKLERNSPSSTTYTQPPPTTINSHQMYTQSTSQFDQTSGSTHNSHKTEHSALYSPNLSSPTSSSYNNDELSIYPSSSTYYPSTNLVARSTTPKPVPETAGSQVSYTSTNASPGLLEIFKENGLFATAKYLKQSGLDSILNETGPYTIFAPTDKAFRTLLIQLGGPDKAEEKFKENPRLLSGVSIFSLYL